MCTYDTISELFGHLVDGVNFKNEYTIYKNHVTTNRVKETKPPHRETESQKEKRMYDEDPVRFFEKNEKVLPNLCKIAKLVLSILSSAAEIERSFSKHKLFLSDRRLSLSANNIKEFMYIQNNFKKVFPNEF